MKCTLKDKSVFSNGDKNMTKELVNKELLIPNDMKCMLKIKSVFSNGDKNMNLCFLLFVFLPPKSCAL